MILLPVPENMNNGKTHSYIEWAHQHALVPPPSAVHPHSHNNSTFASFLSPYPDGNSPYTTATQRENFPSFAANYHAPPPSLAPHDPQPHHEEGSSQPATQADWVRPQFVIKADDDAFVMLAELEARLRLEWYNALKDTSTPSRSPDDLGFDNEVRTQTKAPLQLPQRSTTQVLRESPRTSTVTPYWPEEARNIPQNVDPMIYWGCMSSLYSSVFHLC